MLRKTNSEKLFIFFRVFHHFIDEADVPIFFHFFGKDGFIPIATILVNWH